MTKFEKDTLHTLLFMYEKELEEKGISFSGDKVRDDKVQEIIEKVDEVRTLLGMAD